MDLPVEEGKQRLALGERRGERADFGRSLSHQRRNLRVAVAARRVAQHQRLHAFRVLRGEPERRPAAHRLPHQGGLLDLEVVEQTAQILHERRAPGTVVDVPGVAEPAVVERDALHVPGQHRDLLPPAQVGAARPVREDHRPARAVDLVVQLEVPEPHRRQIAALRGGRCDGAGDDRTGRRRQTSKEVTPIRLHRNLLPASAPPPVRARRRSPPYRRSAPRGPGWAGAAAARQTRSKRRSSSSRVTRSITGRPWGQTVE